MSIPDHAIRPVLSILAIILGVLACPEAMRAQDTAAVALSLKNLERTYAGAAAIIDPASDIEISPGVADDYSFKLTYAGKSTPPKNAGSYSVKVVATSKSLPALSATASGTLVIAKAPLSVAALDQLRHFGVANPVLTLSYAGFVANETVKVLDRRPVGSTLAKSSSPAGDYEIAVTGGADNNYEIVARTPGTLTIVPAFPGTYEALIFDFAEYNTPVGKLSLTLPSRGAAFTGRLELGREGAPLSLSGKLVPDLELLGATGSASRRTSAGDTYRVGVTVDERGVYAALYVTENGTSDEVFLFDLPPLVRLAAYGKSSPCPAAGTHTFVLANPSSVQDLLFPGGSGFSTAPISVGGALKLSGRLADGSKLTASVLPDADLGYRLFIRPYGSRPRSFVSGDFTLKPHPDADRAGRYCVPASAAETVYWLKAPKPSGSADALFPDGFSVETHALLDPWTPPSKAKPATTSSPALPAVTLAQRLALADDPAASGLSLLSHGIEDLGASGYELPAILEFTSANKALPVLAAPPANPRSWKIATTAADGRFSGSFKLRDEVAGTTDASVMKIKTRTLTFQGILRQAPQDDPVIGAGYFLLPPLPDSVPATTMSANLLLERPGI